MPKTLLVTIFFFFIGKIYAQQPGYLVLIDADNNQLFQARIGDTVYNSSEIGHLAIPHLKDSTYRISINFPGTQIYDRAFSVKVNKKDQGFQLRNLGEKGWALYNWQTKELKMPLFDSTRSQGLAERGVKRDDAFSHLMAAVVNDTSVLYNAYVPEKSLMDSSNLQNGINNMADTVK